MEKAHARVISNTIAKLRLMKRHQLQDCLDETWRRVIHLHTMDEIDATNDPKELLTEDDRTELRARYPMAFLAEAAETIEADLESKWRSALRLMSSSACSQDNNHQPPPYYHPQWSLPSLSRHDEGMLSRKRERDSPAHSEGVHWLRELPSVGAIQFAEGCLLQSEQLRRERHAPVSSKNVDTKTGFSLQTAAMLKHLEYAKRQIQKRCDDSWEEGYSSEPTAVTAASTSNQGEEGQQDVPATRSGSSACPEVSFPQPSDFEWATIPMPPLSTIARGATTSGDPDDDDDDDDDLLPYLCPSQDAIDALPCDAVIYASFDLSNDQQHRRTKRDYQWNQICKASATPIRVPHYIYGGTVILRGRGEFAVARVKMIN